MATADPDIETKIAELRDDILSYKPGQAAPCDDERVVFPEKLVIGVIESAHGTIIVPALRQALHGNVDLSKHAVRRKEYSNGEEEYLTDSISVIRENHTYHGSLPEAGVKDLMAKVGCFVLVVSAWFAEYWTEWIEQVQKITGRPPICAVYGERENTNYKETYGVISIYEVPDPVHIRSHSDQDRFHLLSFLQGCLVEADEMNARDTNQWTVEELRKRDEQINLLQGNLQNLNANRLNLIEGNETLRNELKDVQEKKEQSELKYKDELRKTKLHVEALMKTFKKREETAQQEPPQAKEEPPYDDPADILKNIADELCDEADIDRLGGQLGVTKGDITRAIQSNMRFERITSEGTHHMLKQWTKGVSRQDERGELRKALVAAKLVKLADTYFPQEKTVGEAAMSSPERQDLEDSTVQSVQQNFNQHGSAHNTDIDDGNVHATSVQMEGDATSSQSGHMDEHGTRITTDIGMSSEESLLRSHCCSCCCL